ncbi:GNAT family N-acetyltransferase [Rossellomorea aquimaris]|uniref:GNAT family N-acetyltransferase n=1 Tax=Rossellomorea aquimaris TaxID=189382 RepID=UPI001CD415A8|nr:GNAT family protein [Rossellomorea aquimaris]MCA1061578.1 GNAT family N-acetyltransferase [Rossellomorea aquimaris]
MEKYPLFETERLVLRQITMENVDFLYELYTSDDVLKYFGMSPIQSKDVVVSMVENYEKQLDLGGPMRFAIVEKQTDKMIGTCGFHGISKAYKRCEIGYDLIPDQWGKGIMGEALSPLLNYLFMDKGMNRIGAVIVPYNKASSRVVEKLGFKQEGLLRDYILQGDHAYDAYMYSLLKKEWLE